MQSLRVLTSLVRAWREQSQPFLCSRHSRPMLFDWPLNKGSIFMSRFRMRSSRSRSTSSRSWLKSVVRFRRSFPWLLRRDILAERSGRWLVAITLPPQKLSEKRRRNRQGCRQRLGPVADLLPPRAARTPHDANFVAGGLLTPRFNLTGTQITSFGGSHAYALRRRLQQHDRRHDRRRHVGQQIRARRV